MVSYILEVSKTYGSTFPNIIKINPRTQKVEICLSLFIEHVY